MRGRALSLWFLLLFAGLTALFAYDGCDVLFNPHVVGYTTKYGNHVRFRDSGDRFLYAVGLLVIAIVGADGVRRLLQAEQKKISDLRWAWEVTVDGRTVEVAESGFTASFALDDDTRARLLNGWDDISLTLRHDVEIDRFEATHTGGLESPAAALRDGDAALGSSG